MCHLTIYLSLTIISLLILYYGCTINIVIIIVIVIIVTLINITVTVILEKSSGGEF